MKLLAIAAAMILLPAALPAQGTGAASTMKIDRPAWNMGRIKEADGAVKRVFNFTNTGREAFVIERVTVTCGCTSLSYTKEPVQPGRSGTLTIEYNPTGRAGAVSHEVVIASRRNMNRNVITITGEVIPRPRSVVDDYPFETVAGMRFSTLSLNFGHITQGEVKSMVVGYINTADREMKLDFRLPGARDFLKVAGPGTVCAGCRGEITVTYDLSGTVFYGRYLDRIYPVIDGKRQELPVSTVFTAIDGGSATARKNAPVAVLTPMYHNFGEVEAGQRLTESLTLSNTGKTPLIVRWVGTGNSMSATLKPGAVVRPGDSVEFTVAMDVTATGSGNVTTDVVTIITNDPSKPIREVRFAAVQR